MDDQPSRSNNDAASRERLIDRFADKILGQRLRAQQSNLPKNVTNITLSKADIGRHPIGVGMFASVLPDAHSQGVQALLNARAQMLQYPLTQAEVDAYRATLRTVIAKQKSKTSLPEPFGDALQIVSENFFADKPIRTPTENARRAEAHLAHITPAQVTARIQQWLNAATSWCKCKRLRSR